jgi:GTP cyclohydrolase I
LPFTGNAWVAYIPDGRVVGLSKVPRLVEHYARQPQVQERLTAQITTALDKFVGPLGSACLIRAIHTCASLRGVRKEAPMTTSSLTGAFRTDLAAREEFLALTRGAP